MEGERRAGSSDSNDTDGDQLCPLCMEILDETDRNLYPCTCGYQVCLWCLHYIRNTMGNKCPACRRDYDESNIKYKTKPRVSSSDSRALTTKKKCEQSDRDSTAREEKAAPSTLRRNNAVALKDVRVVQRNLVYVVGIPMRLAKKEILKRDEYFGHYGKIQHIALNKSQTYNSHWGGTSYTAYITYSKKSEAAEAIQGIDGSQLDNRLLRASYGTTKYCSYFLKGMKCCNVDCFYLHQFGDERTCFTKEDIIASKQHSNGVPYGCNVQSFDQNYSANKYKEERQSRWSKDHGQVKLLNLLQSKSKLASKREIVSTYNTADTGELASWANITTRVKKPLDVENFRTSDKFSGYDGEEKGTTNTSAPFDTKSTRNNCSFPAKDEGQADCQHISNGSVVQDVYTQCTPDSSSNFGRTGGEDFHIVPQKGQCSQKSESNQFLAQTSSQDVNVKAMDPTEAAHYIFRIPLHLMLQSYNRLDQLFYAVNISEELSSQEQNPENVAPSDGGSASDCSVYDGFRIRRCWKLIRTDDPNATKLYESCIDKGGERLDHYRANNVKGNVSKEYFFGNSLQRVLLPDEGLISEIVQKIRRHTLLLDNLSRKYNPETSPLNSKHIEEGAADDDLFVEDSLYIRKTQDAHNGAISSEDADHASCKSNRDNFDDYTSILCDIPSDKSQLDAHLKVYEQLQLKTQKLVEYQQQRRHQLIQHLETLYDAQFV